jgi:hypothetical protein
MKRNLIEYVNLVHAHGLRSKVAEDFKKSQKDDPAFSRRVKVLDDLFLNRDEILKDTCSQTAREVVTTNIGTYVPIESRGIRIQPEQRLKSGNRAMT